MSMSRRGVEGGGVDAADQADRGRAEAACAGPPPPGPGSAARALAARATGRMWAQSAPVYCWIQDRQEARSV